MIKDNFGKVGLVATCEPKNIEFQFLIRTILNEMKHVLSVLSNQQRETDVKLTVMREAAYGGW